MATRLVRPRKGRMVAGVCAGIADRLGADRTLIRLLYMVATIVSIGFPGLLVYVILWLVMPSASRT